MKKTNSKIVFLWLLLIFPFMLSTSSCQSKKSTQEATAVEIPTVTLSNGVEMPMLGFGTLDLGDSVAINSVAKAMVLGYRLFDTATIYGNEEAVGKGIQKGLEETGLSREDLFITTKLWVDDSGYEETKRGFERSLEKLGLEYVDLYLIHRPRGKDIQGSWKAMEELYEAGKIRAIGVSNFESQHLAELLSYATIKPMVNQIESSPFFQQYAAQAELKELGIQMEAWSCFAQGRNDIFNNLTLVAIGEKYDKSAAQVILRWQFQRGVVTIPRTDNPNFMAENLNIFDFELNDSDIQEIIALDLNTTQFPEWE